MAMRLPGSRQVGIGKKILAQQEWWRFEPHPEWVQPHSTTFLEPHADWFDVMKRWNDEQGEFMNPFAAGIPGQIRLIYIPGRIYDPLGPLVTNIEKGVVYHASYIDPITGAKQRLGTLVNPQTAARFSDNFDSTRKPEWVDLKDKTTPKGGELSGGRSTWTVVRGVKESDVIASVDARSDSEAGILLRLQESGDGVVAVYSPAMKGIWIHERLKGEYGQRMGFTAVPYIGQQLHMVAEVHGRVASLTVTDGKQIFRTAPVRVSLGSAGTAGLWTEALVCQAGRFGGCRSAEGDEASRPAQRFDNFALQAIYRMPADADENIIILNAWRAPLLPVSHDWLLMLER